MSKLSSSYALTDNEWEILRNFHPGITLGESWRFAIEAVLSKRDTNAQPAPKLDGALVQRMCAAFDAAQDDCIGSDARAMAAALSVANEARDAQWEKAILDEIHEECAKPLAYCLTVTKGCRERLTANPKTLEERVTVTEDAKWARVFVDGVKKYSFEQSENGEELASALREGLIARMKREQVQP